MFHRHQPPTSRANEYPVEEAPVKWVSIDSAAESLPADAFPACVLETGEEAFVAMAYVRGQTVTGLTTRSGMQASVAYGTSEHVLDCFKVLTTNVPDVLFWFRSSNGKVPRRAVKGGTDRSETSFIGRTCTPLSGGRTWLRVPISLNRNITGGSRLGKIHPSHECLYIPYNGAEFIYNAYEVLCHKISPASLALICRWKIYERLIELNRDFASINNLPLPASLRDFLKK